MHSYEYEKQGAVNAPLLDEELKTTGLNLGVGTRPGFVTIHSEIELTGQQQTDIGAIITAHNPAGMSTRQKGLTQLVAFLDSRADDLKYGDYFYKLQKRLIDLWGTKPNLTNTTTEVVKGLRGGKDSTAEITDPDHLAIYNSFLWFVQRAYGVVLVAGDLPPPPLSAAQAQAINAAAYAFMVNGVTMLNMILLNQRG